FNLAVIPTLAPYLLPLFVESFRTKYPKVQLRLFEYQTDEIINYLKEDKIDAAILATPLEVKGIKEEVLFYEPFQILFSPKHPLLENKEIKESELNIEEAWLLKEGHCMRSQALQLCKPTKGPIERAVFFEGGSIETLVNLLNSMHGFTVVPELSIPHFNQSVQKRIRTFKGKRPVREISMITGPFALKESIANAIKKIILENVPGPVLAETKKDVIIEIS
ncbi:MAG: hydrogen peroxide-inducible genes activator, partial [Bacteriovoracaceae bacterium]|nr:hydrogen peroxide-inducible genes activator [Bacteriovoracaceae bacterium]